MVQGQVLYCSPASTVTRTEQQKLSSVGGVYTDHLKTCRGLFEWQKPSTLLGTPRGTTHDYRNQKCQEWSQIPNMVFNKDKMDETHELITAVSPPQDKAAWCCTYTSFDPTAAPPPLQLPAGAPQNTQPTHYVGCC
ncbi:unnamed protein product [Amoebophrya sp. A120]|nr:unnamed protein product [Amoebophrya sp. A120]|eukprot:GSA120T00001869001.1